MQGHSRIRPIGKDAIRWLAATVAFVAVAASAPAQTLQPPGMSKRPKGAARFKPQVVKFEAADGIIIEADYYPPKVAETQRAPVAILIHMYPADRKGWKPLIPALRKVGFGVLAYDIRGHGGSAEQPGRNMKEAYDQRDHALFAEAWLDAEAARLYLQRDRTCDTSRVVLIGASIGCSISLDYAGREPAIKAVVCLSPGVDYLGLDSLEHIKKCTDRSILLISPEGEYAAVKKLKKASEGAAKSKKYAGGNEWHGTKMFDAPYGKKIIKRIVKFVSGAVGMEAAGDKDKGAGKAEGGEKKPKKRKRAHTG